MSAADVGLVIIGRNEGERLRRCLESTSKYSRRVYVDSGSTDGSVKLAEDMVVTAIELPVPPAFTAARSRNTGIDALAELHPDIRIIQMIDGDCEVQPGWIEAGITALDADAGLGAVFGRRRERFPGQSVYNALCDDEWNVPIGEVEAFGGDVMLRVEAIRAVTGYDDTMIAGEDPDFAMRMRAAGWRILRINADMTLHDAAITRFGQWWMRVRRAGHAFGQLADRHPDAISPDWSRSCRSILFWGGILPALVLLLLFTGLLLPEAAVMAGLLLLIWPLKIVQIAIRQRRRLGSWKLALASGTLLMVGKFAELRGLMTYRRNRQAGRASSLIEYKGAAS